MASRQPKEYGIQNLAAFMNDYRFTLSQILNVEEVFPWLRNNGIIDPSDEERIMNTYRTSPERAGALMDVLVKRGKRGINAFMEHIEYEHEDQYQLITGRAAEPPGHDYKRPQSVRRRTIAHLQQITETLMKGMESLAKNQQIMANNLIQHSTLKPLEGGFLALDEEIDMKNKQINNLTQKILEDKELIRLLQNQCDQYKDEKDNASEECEQLRKAKDKYQAECNQLRSEKEKHGELTRNSMKQASCRERNRNLQSEVSNTRPLSKEGDKNTEIKALYSKVAELNIVKAKLEDENVDAAAEVATLQADIDTYRENNQIFSAQVQDMQHERDKALLHLEQCRKKCEDLQKSNLTLREDYSNANSRLRSMRSEHSLRPRLHPVQSHTCLKCGESSRRKGLQELTQLFKSFDADADEDGGRYSRIDDRKVMIPAYSDSDEESPPQVHPRKQNTAAAVVKQKKP